MRACYVTRDAFKQSVSFLQSVANLQIKGLKNTVMKMQQ